MKAWILERQSRIEDRPLKLVDIPDPEPREGQIRIKVRFCGICRTDLHIAEGDHPLHKKPVILGHQIVGIVDKSRGRKIKEGDRVGLTWLYSSCNSCKYCLTGRENYCPDIVRTGWDADGGFAEYVIAEEEYVAPLDIPLKDEDCAPLMCPGVIAHLCYELAEIKPGDKVGIIGFGPTAFYLVKIANYIGADVYVSTRSRHHQDMAAELNAKWVGNIAEREFPEKMDSIVYFPPTGDIFTRALRNLGHGGILVLAPIASQSPMVVENYGEDLWGRDIRTVYNIRRSTIKNMLNLARKIDFSIEKEVFDFEELQDAMIAVRSGKLDKMTAVVRVS